MAGRHRFSRYRLLFALAADSRDGATRLSATTYAAFPGPHGAAYRFVVIGSVRTCSQPAGCWPPWRPERPVPADFDRLREVR